MSAPDSTPRIANPRRFAILSGVALVLVIALLFWARPLIRELIVLPLSYLFWAVGIFLKNTPEKFFWAVLLIITGLAAYRSLIGRSVPAVDVPVDTFEGAYDRPFRGQVSLWRLRVNNMRDTESSYLHSTFEQSVGKLLFETLSHRYHLSFNEIERRLREDSLDVPPPVREYALHSLRRLDAMQPQRLVDRLRGQLLRLWGSISLLFGGAEDERKKQMKNPRLARDIQRLDVVLSYMEKDLEVPNDDTGQ